MTTLLFLFTVAAVFGAILGLESETSGRHPETRNFGLIAWLTTGNWPAKVGGGLLVVGIGALIRYAMLNLDVPDSWKIGTGVVASALLGLGATLTRVGTPRRAVSLALGGAAFGTAYLTAYSAFALFGYLENETGLALLLLTAVGAGVYAIMRESLSLAMLAMLGAYLAPAFAVTDPGPTIVYGYYVAASVLTLGIVMIRGWRPLIHLSFLFTLAGGVFFAWTRQYFTTEHYQAMLPAVFLLAAVHLLMPIVERRGSDRLWVQQLDGLYLLTLPAAATMSAVVLAPSRTVLSNMIVALALLWLAAAVYLRLAKRDGAAVHAIVGTLMLGVAVAIRFRDLPWELIALAFTVGLLWWSSRREHAERLQSILAGLVPLVGVFHVVNALAPALSDRAFANGRFVERAIGAGLLMLAGRICSRIGHSLTGMLWSIGIGWLCLAIGFELLRIDWLSVALLLYWLSIAAAVAIGLLARRNAAWVPRLLALPIAIGATAVWATSHAAVGAAWLSMIAGAAVLTWLTVAHDDSDNSAAAITSAFVAPAMTGLWALSIASAVGAQRFEFGLFLALLCALSIVAAILMFRRGASPLKNSVTEIYTAWFILVLIASTTMVISRSAWSIAAELCCLVGLALIIGADAKAPRFPAWVTPVAVICGALWLQAMALRWLGPPGTLTIASLADMEAPAVISLLWAVFGAGLTIWARQRGSRSIWMAGAVLLVAATVKIILLDFGSLGQLANILAVIAAGLVFMAVGWLAPMPAERAPTPAAAAVVSSPVSATTAASIPDAASEASIAREVHGRGAVIHVEDNSRGRAWAIAIALLILVSLARCSGELGVLRRLNDRVTNGADTSLDSARIDP